MKPTSTAITPSEQADLARLESVIERTAEAASEWFAAMSEIRNRKLWRDSASSWEEYCEQRWNMSKRQANRLIQAEKVRRSLPNATGAIKKGGLGRARPKTPPTLSIRASSEAAKIKDPEKRAKVVEAAALSGLATERSIREEATRQSVFSSIPKQEPRVRAPEVDQPRQPKPSSNGVKVSAAQVKSAIAAHSQLGRELERMGLTDATAEPMQNILASIRSGT